MNPLMVELFAGLHGWGEGAIAEGYRVVGFDIVDMCSELGYQRPEGIELVLQDVLTLHGSQFRNAKAIVASPPCQAYSYRAMPWSRAKALPPPSNELFEACFRIQGEACEAAGRHIPMVVENVRGAQKWVGRAGWHFGSYFLWGDIPALMPITLRRSVMKRGITHRGDGSTNFRGHKNEGGSWFAIAHNTTSGHGQNPDGRKGIPHRPTGIWTNPAENVKVPGLNWSGYGKSDYKAQAFNGTAAQNYRHQRSDSEGIKMRSPGNYKKPGSGPDWFDGGPARHGSKSNSRKAASAQIAKIPFPLAQHIARCFKEIANG